MAGRPNLRIKRLSAALTEALAAGRRDEATMLYAEVRRIATEAGLPIPELPSEASELWLQVTERVPIRDPVQKPIETKLSDALTCAPGPSAYEQLSNGSVAPSSLHSGQPGTGSALLW